MEPKSFQTQTDEAPCAVRVFICTIMGAEKNLNEQKHAFNNRKKSVQNVANRTRIEAANKKKTELSLLSWPEQGEVDSRTAHTPTQICHSK